MNKYAIGIIVLFVAWAAISWNWYTCGVKGFCDESKAPVAVIQGTDQNDDERVCRAYIDDYMEYGQENDLLEVSKLQGFLRDVEGYDVEMTGIFDQQTYNAVARFQERYSEDVLEGAWGISQATGIIFKSTKRKINELYCEEKDLPLTLN